MPRYPTVPGAGHTARPESLVSNQPLLTVLYLVLPVLGGGVGYALMRLSDWMLSLPWLPFQGALELVQSLPQPGVTIALVVLGGLAGLWLASEIAGSQMTVAVTDHAVVLRRGQDRQELARTQVHRVFTDGSDLVLHGAGGTELARERHDLNLSKLHRAFSQHGYPWRTGDPYVEQFRPWVSGAPDLPEGADGLLANRAKAVEQDADGQLARDYRHELSRLGVAVRDSGGRQHWRRTQVP